MTTPYTGNSPYPAMGFPAALNAETEAEKVEELETPDVPEEELEEDESEGAAVLGALADPANAEAIERLRPKHEG
ncbi:hypothetical protein FH969_03390 [Miniimonas arenae]|uniref:Uncharacterized protein n=1 Tax=Miniimonas arenae TaxID=676201 RepID=A0A5C5BFI8_9MICO|nr:MULTISPECIES: hypothetical protein [Miniimonas]TNU76429.1 hypothetical protein FH969_03390 [Miniimonas arenae]